MMYSVVWIVLTAVGLLTSVAAYAQEVVAEVAGPPPDAPGWLAQFWDFPLGFEWLTVGTVVMMFGSIVTTASVITRLTPTQVDNEFIDKVIGMINRFGLNGAIRVGTAPKDPPA